MADSTTKRQEETYQYQRDRIVRIVSELEPGAVVEFDEASTMIRFRIRNPLLDINLTNASPHWLPSELADKSDDDLRQLIKNLTNQLIR